MSSTQKSSISSAKRLLATAASAAMIFALLPAGVALGASPDNVCPPPDGVETFPDVTDGVHADNVECLAGYDIAGGYADGTYRPGVDISRAQMATFVANFIESALGVTLDEGDDAFTDDEGNVHESNINKLANIDVVTGRTAVTYGPSLKVNRAAMATFIANALDYLDDQDATNNSFPPASTTDHFTDDEASTHEANINRLADQGIVEGQDSATEYNPGNNVFRGQMASFVMQAASDAEEADLWAANDEAPAEPTTNQDHPATPSEKAINTVSSGSSNNTGARSYSVSGLDDTTTYDLELHEAEHVHVDENGVVTFTDNTPASTAGVSFETVNGAVVGTAGGTEAREVHNVTPVNGTITFSVDSTSMDQVVPVINADADGDNTLDLATGTAPTAPTESFGIGGEKEWIPAEAASLEPNTDDDDIIRVNKAEDYFVGDSDPSGTPGTLRTFYYDSNDTFQIAQTNTGDGNDGAASECLTVTMATFEAELSSGDELDVSSSYNAEESLPSTFCLEDLAPSTPSFTTAEVDEDTVRLTITHATTDDQLRISRMQDPDSTDDGTCPANTDTRYAQIAEVAAESDGSTIYNDNGLTAGTVYCYFVQAVDDGDTSAKTATQDENTSAAGATVQPQSIDARLTTDSNFQGVADTGDVWKIVFDKDMDTVTTGTQVRIQDAQGETDTVRCGTEATCSWNENATEAVGGTTYQDDRVLTVTLNVSLATENTVSGASGVLEYPLTITTQSGVEDQNGNSWTPSDDPDRVIDAE